MKTIPLSGGGYALISDRDYPYLKQFTWWQKRVPDSDLVYARRQDKGEEIPMHREIMGDPKGVFIDHRDGNGLNNTRSNLRHCTHSQNMQNKRMYKNNTAGYKGVSPDSYSGWWKAQITINGRRVCLGYFHTKEEAAIYYNEAAKEHYGAFARLNILPSEYGDIIPQPIRRGDRPQSNNSSGFLGVICYKAEGNWGAAITYDSQRIYLSRFSTKEEAAYIRDQFALQLYGPTAKLNIIDKDQSIL